MTNHLHELEEVWMRAWQRELGADATLTDEEQTELHTIRQDYKNSVESQAEITIKYKGTSLNMTLDQWHELGKKVCNDSA